MLFQWIKYIKAILAFMELLANLFGSKEEAVKWIKTTQAQAKRMPALQARNHFERMQATMAEDVI